MTDTISPEERLFNVIKEQKGSGSGGEASKPNGVSGIKRLFGNLKLHRGASGKDGGRVASASVRDIDPRLINRLLTAVLVMLVLSYVWFLGNTRPDISKITKTSQKTGMAGKKEVEPLKPLDTYISEIKQRDIFRPVPKELSVGTSTSKEAMERLKDAARDLKVVGISSGDNPTALIHSTRDNSTYFLKKGQKIGKTDVEIREISKQKVTIGYQDEKLDLP